MQCLVGPLGGWDVATLDVSVNLGHGCVCGPFSALAIHPVGLELRLEPGGRVVEIWLGMERCSFTVCELLQEPKQSNQSSRALLCRCDHGVAPAPSPEKQALLSRPLCSPAHISSRNFQLLLASSSIYAAISVFCRHFLHRPGSPEPCLFVTPCICSTLPIIYPSGMNRAIAHLQDLKNNNTHIRG